MHFNSVCVLDAVCHVRVREHTGFMHASNRHIWSYYSHMCGSLGKLVELYWTKDKKIFCFNISTWRKQIYYSTKTSVEMFFILTTFYDLLRLTACKVHVKVRSQVVKTVSLSKHVWNLASWLDWSRTELTEWMNQWLFPCMNSAQWSKETTMRLVFKCREWILPQVMRQRVMWMKLIIKVRTHCIIFYNWTVMCFFFFHQ